MILQERIELMVKLGAYLEKDGEEWQEVKERAYQQNGWFTPGFIQHAALQISEGFLKKEDLQKWAAHYHIDDNIKPKNIGIFMAGNIPMVGFHDMLAVFICGHRQTIKLSAKDEVLLKHLINVLTGWNKETEQYIAFAGMLKGCDGYIATGSNNSAHAFEEYFGKYAHIIRRNRTSVAVLKGNETADQLQSLADDIHLYFGLGCRNVTKLYVPETYDFIPLLKSFEPYKYFADHHKYKNNFDYQLSLLLLNHIYYMSNEATLLSENKSIFSPISHIYFEYYSDPNKLSAELKVNDDIQAIIGNDFMPFGEAQHPGLFTYADGVDTMEFLLGL